MTTWFVSRHKGAIEWMKQQNIKVDRWETHLNPSEVKSGDTVIGVLPMGMAAKICQQGAVFYALDFSINREQRGKELVDDELSQLGCKLLRYDVRAIGE